MFALTLTSSSPSSPETTSACFVPNRSSTCAIFAASVASATPSTCASAPAGLVNGPRMLKTVRTPISRRSPPANFIAGWNACANMKPKPACSMLACTPAGGRSILPPSASSTSALPQALVIARLPCLATRTPAPAATKAAAVLTLKTLLPLPPVPQVSSSGPSTSTWSDFSRITRAMPVISSTVSPFSRSATTNAPNWAGVASADMICSIQPAASSSERSRPSTSLAIASRIID